MPQPVTKMLTKIAPHIREGHAVKGYRAQRLKALGTEDIGSHEKIGKESFQEKYSEVEQHIFDENGDLHDEVPTNELETQAKRLFSLGTESGVDPIIFSNDKFVSNVYEAQAHHIESPIDLASAHPRDALGMLLDRDNMKTIIQSVDGLQAKFWGDLNLDSKPERVDPFTFKFKHKANIDFDNPEVRAKIIEYSGEKIQELRMANPTVFDEMHTSPVLNYSHLVDGLKSVHKKNPAYKRLHGKDEPVDKYKAASVILSNINGANSFVAPRLSKEGINGLTKHMNENGLGQMFYTEGVKPDDLKAIMSKKLRASPITFPEKDAVTKFFRDIDSGSVVPAFNLMKKQAILPTFMADNKDIMNRVNKIAEGIKQSFEQIKGEHESTIYVSRNPMNVLTMAPEKSCPSCQSLTRDGKLKLTLGGEPEPANVELGVNAINIPASYNTQNTNDFIMYTVNGEKQKNARMSMSYDKRNDSFVSYEKFSTYGESRQDRAVMRQFVEERVNGEENPEIENRGFELAEENDVVMRDVKAYIPVQSKFNSLTKGLNDIDKAFDSQIADESYDEAKQTFKELSDSHNQWQQNRESVVNSYFDGMNDMYYSELDKNKSLLYGSPAFSLVKGSKAIGKQFKTDLTNLNSRYEDSFQQMKERISTRVPSD